MTVEAFVLYGCTAACTWLGLRERRKRGVMYALHWGITYALWALCLAAYARSKGYL